VLAWPLDCTTEVRKTIIAWWPKREEGGGASLQLYRAKSIEKSSLNRAFGREEFSSLKRSGGYRAGAEEGTHLRLPGRVQVGGEKKEKGLSGKSQKKREEIASGLIEGGGDRNRLCRGLHIRGRFPSNTFVVEARLKDRL